MNRRDPNKLYLSVSQIKAFKSCRRDWFIKNVLKLKKPPMKATTFGSVLHEVCERWLASDELDQIDGKPVELYPDTWEFPCNFGKKAAIGLDRSEMKLVPDLIDKAIAQGVLWKHPEGHIEHEFEVNLTKDIVLVGAIDYAFENTIVDHKSCKNYKYTLTDKVATDKFLGADLQMLTYGYVWAKKIQEDTGNELPEQMHLQHNQFCKEGSVKKVHVTLPWKDIETNWKGLVHTAKQIQKVKDRAPDTGDFTHIPKPTTVGWKSPCKAYGGCSYVDLCGGVCSQETYKKRIASMYEAQEPKQQEKESERNMNENFWNEAVDNLKTDGAPKKQEAKVEEKKAPVKEKGTKQEEKPVVPEGTAPEVTLDEVTAAIADLQPKLKQMQDMAATGIDMTSVTSKLEAQIEGLEAIQAELEAKAVAEKEAAEALKKKEKAAAAKARRDAKKKKEEEDAKASQTAEEVAEDLVNTPVQKSDNDRSVDMVEQIPTGDFTLCIGTVPLKGNFYCTMDILTKYGNALARQQNVDSYFELDAFKRRDTLATEAKTIADDLKGSTLSLNLGSPEDKNLAAILQPFADKVYQALVV